MLALFGEGIRFKRLTKMLARLGSANHVVPVVGGEKDHYVNLAGDESYLNIFGAIFPIR